MENLNKEIIKELSKIVMEVTGNEDLELNPTTTANEVAGWDSLSHVQILYKCELKWGIRLTLKELSNLNNVGDLVNTIVKYLKRNNSSKII